MPTTIDSAGITFNDATSLTSAVIPANAVGATQIANGSVTASKLGTTEQKQIAKAWVNFNGTLASPITPRASYNVSSVTKNGTGDYTVNFTTAMADANYNIVGTSTQDTALPRAITINEPNPVVRTTSSCKIFSTYYEATKFDANTICLTVFGN